MYNMKFLQNIAVEVDKEELLIMLGKDLSASKLLKDNEDVISMGKELVLPRAVYEIFEVHKAAGNRLHLTPEEYFESELFSYFTASAEYAALCITTIGAELEQASDRYAEQNDYVKKRILDAVGSVVLHKAQLQLYEYIKKEALLKELNYSAPISPGQVGWDIADQAKIFSRLQPDAVGVQLTSSNLMFPVKSGSMLVGFGMNVKADKKVCDYCDLQATCPMRKVKDYSLI